ncbi:MAG: hypothetical protein WDZ46_09200 [Solirubrobacterales bacterium]
MIMKALLKLISICCIGLLLAGCDTLRLSPHRQDEKSIAVAFEVLRTPSERMSPALVRHIARLRQASERDTLVNTQLARTKAGRIWIFLTGKQMCLIQAEFGSISCTQKRLARSKGVVLGTFKPPTKAKPYLHRFLVLGVLPDDVRYVSATVGRAGDKRHVREPVRDNVFAVAAEQPVLVRGLGRQ